MRPRGCPLCAGGGLVMLERVLPDNRHVVDAYRCGCEAGTKVSAAFAPLPGPAQLTPVANQP